MEENNNEKISVSGADLLKDVVADEKAAKTAPKDTEKDKKDKDKKKEKKTKDGKKFNAKSSSMEQWQQCSPAFLSLCLSW